MVLSPDKSPWKTLRQKSFPAVQNWTLGGTPTVFVSGDRQRTLQRTPLFISATFSNPRLS